MQHDQGLQYGIMAESAVGDNWHEVGLDPGAVTCGVDVIARRSASKATALVEVKRIDNEWSLCKMVNLSFGHCYCSFFLFLLTHLD